MNLRVLAASTVALLAVHVFGSPVPVGKPEREDAHFPLAIVASVLEPVPLVLDTAGAALMAAALETARVGVMVADIHASSEIDPAAVGLQRPAPLPPEHRRVQDYIDVTIARLDRRVGQAMKWIDGAGRRLLALKYYLRRQGQIPQRWSWTLRQTARYRGTAEYHQAMMEVAKVKAKFAELNPGYALQVNTQVRMLEEQIAIWNTTPSVTAAGSVLLEQCMGLLADTAFAGVAGGDDLARFQELLENHKVAYVPTVAVPGLSEHGQLRAFDFIILQGDQIIATTESSSITAVWDNSGWTAKLKDAVTAASNRFEGPLASPREPWHYSYRP